MCRVEIILIVFIFLWSLFILFFCLGKKKIRWESIYLFISWDKKTIVVVVVQKVAAFERKIGFIILHTLYYKAFTAGVVGVQKGRRRRL